MVGFVALSLYAAWPGIAQELSPRPNLPVALADGVATTAVPAIPPVLATFEVAGISHAAIRPVGEAGIAGAHRAGAGRGNG